MANKSSTSGTAATRRKRGPRRKAGRPPASRPALGSKQEILEAALRAFGERGFEEMSVRRLAQQLGVSHNLIAHYYSSKEELWRACVDWSIGTINRELLGMATEMQNDVDILTVMRTIMERFIHMAARFPANLFIVTQEGSNEGKRLEYLYTQLMEPSQQGWNVMIQRAIDEKKIRSVDPRTIFFLLTQGGASIFTMVPLARRMGGPEPLDPAFIEQQARDVADILLRGLMIETPPLTVSKTRR
ncbi:MAG TPA: TetR/AcrR family transcriptional regulator [Candidatus Binatia bacterium]|nr:TetR/AcrR family transcriptional regulator [Candidatus Binatia bacterium]